MATPFTDVYDSFLTKIDDPTLLSMTQSDLEDLMMNWLMSAITYFPKCTKDLNDYDNVAMQFTADLDLSEIEILATWMKYEYLDKHIYKETLIEQSLSSKDYAMYSQANHLQQLMTLKDMTYREATKKVTDYLFLNTDYSDLG